MTVSPCKECGNEVSSKAKTCPHCGAPIKRRSNIVPWLAFAIVIAVVVAYFEALLQPKPDLPTCDSDDAEAAVRSAIEDSPRARIVNAKLLAMRDQQEVSYDEAKPERKCKATAFLNAGESAITYRLFKVTPDDARFLVEVNFE